jgi:hypothetical protein
MTSEDAQLDWIDCLEQRVLAAQEAYWALRAHYVFSEKIEQEDTSRIRQQLALSHRRQATKQGL